MHASFPWVSSAVQARARRPRGWATPLRSKDGRAAVIRVQWEFRPQPLTHSALDAGALFAGTPAPDIAYNRGWFGRLLAYEVAHDASPFLVRRPGSPCHGPVGRLLLSAAPGLRALPALRTRRQPRRHDLGVAQLLRLRPLRRLSRPLLLPLPRLLLALLRLSARRGRRRFRLRLPRPLPLGERATRVRPRRRQRFAKQTARAAPRGLAWIERGEKQPPS